MNKTTIIPAVLVLSLFICITGKCASLTIDNSTSNKNYSGYVEQIAASPDFSFKQYFFRDIDSSSIGPDTVWVESYDGTNVEIINKDSLFNYTPGLNLACSYSSNSTIGTIALSFCTWFQDPLGGGGVSGGNAYVYVNNSIFPGCSATSNVNNGDACEDIKSVLTNDGKYIAYFARSNDGNLYYSLGVLALSNIIWLTNSNGDIANQLTAVDANGSFRVKILQYNANTYKIICVFSGNGTTNGFYSIIGTLDVSNLGKPSLTWSKTINYWGEQDRLPKLESWDISCTDTAHAQVILAYTVEDKDKQYALKYKIGTIDFINNNITVNPQSYTFFSDAAVNDIEVDENSTVNIHISPDGTGIFGAFSSKSDKPSPYVFATSASIPSDNQDIPPYLQITDAPVEVSKIQGNHFATAVNTVQTPDGAGVFTKFVIFSSDSQLTICNGTINWLED